MITVVKAVEMLDFGDTPESTVILESEGRRLVQMPLGRRASLALSG